VAEAGRARGVVGDRPRRRVREPGRVPRRVRIAAGPTAGRAGPAARAARARRRYAADADHRLRPAAARRRTRRRAAPAAQGDRGAAGAGRGHHRAAGEGSEAAGLAGLWHRRRAGLREVRLLRPRHRAALRAAEPGAPRGDGGAEEHPPPANRPDAAAPLARDRGPARRVRGAQAGGRPPRDGGAAPGAQGARPRRGRLAGRQVRHLPRDRRGARRGAAHPRPRRRPRSGLEGAGRHPAVDGRRGTVTTRPIAIAVLFACKPEAAPPPARNVPKVEGDQIRYSPEFAKGAGIKLETVAIHEVAPDVMLPGSVQLDQRRSAAVGTRIPGRVRKILKLEGEEVKAGDVLAEIESGELGHAQTDLLKARAKEEHANAEKVREQKLAQAKISALREAQAAEAAATAARAERLAAEQSLKALGGDPKDIGEIGVLELRSPI